MRERERVTGPAILHIERKAFCETFVALICCQGNTRQEMIEVEATAKHEIYYRVSFDVSLTATARFVSQTNAYHFLFHEQCFPFVNRSICDHPS